VKNRIQECMVLCINVGSFRTVVANSYNHNRIESQTSGHLLELFSNHVSNIVMSSPNVQYLLLPSVLFIN